MPPSLKVFGLPPTFKLFGPEPSNFQHKSPLPNPRNSFIRAQSPLVTPPKVPRRAGDTKIGSRSGWLDPLLTSPYVPPKVQTRQKETLQRPENRARGWPPMSCPPERVPGKAQRCPRPLKGLWPPLSFFPPETPSPYSTLPPPGFLNFLFPKDSVFFDRWGGRNGISDGGRVGTWYITSLEPWKGPHQCRCVVKQKLKNWWRSMVKRGTNRVFLSLDF